MLRRHRQVCRPKIPTISVVELLRTFGQPNNVAFYDNAKRGKAGPDRVGDVARAQVGVVPFGHAGIGVAKLPGNDRHRHAAHGQRRAMGMAQDVKADGG